MASHEIRDGISNTILIGERRRDDSIDGIDLGWMSGTGSSLRHAGQPPNARDPKRPGLPLVTMPLLNGMSPPAPGEAIGGFSSFHSGGAQFALCDGSVRFISENIAPDVFSFLGRREDGAMIGEF
ncbi:MAG: DUF1559 domain-containing protein [Planctomycetaceae bacterium]